ncbi:MAG: type II toxin-antitoxin system VapC family toxin [Synergistaceae bacterium]|jgi:predicted nucleic acid-binding protein|nr:type II toxin-antitoxin system VapC family toxin [Synergistaceae bacterium]
MTRPTFVVDASVVLAWFNPLEQSDYADKILGCLNREAAIAPPLCALEVNNVLRGLEKKGALSKLEAEQALQSIANLPIALDGTPHGFQMPLVSSLAREYDLTIYDACYLELAMRLNLPLSTLDKQLLIALDKTEVSLKKPQS